MSTTDRVKLALFAGLFLVPACSNSPTDYMNPDPVLTQVSPAVLPAQAATATLQLHGDGFSRSSRVSYGGVLHAPQFISANQLELTLSRDAMLAPAGAHVEVRVVTPAPGGGLSAPTLLPRDFGVPVVNPSSSLTLVRGDTLRTYTITGDNFTPYTLVYIWPVPPEDSPGMRLYHQVAVVSAGKQSLVARVRGWDPTFSGPYYLHVMNPDSVRSNAVRFY